MTPNKVVLDDTHWMGRALELAKQGLGATSPNPCVGAVIVKRAKFISEGFHKKAGSDHAEIVALKKAGLRAKGSTLYVTLEPCAHFGRTPPCAEAIVKSGIRRVVIAQKDPNPLVCGKGIKLLRRRGLEVRLGVLEGKAGQLNRPFEKWVLKKMPYVTLKTAQSLDGKIASKTGESRWITGEKSRTFVQKLRSIQDAILVGINTVLKDDPRLDVRIRADCAPAKIILDTHLKIPANAKVFSTKGKTIIFTGKQVNSKKRGIFSKNAEIIPCPVKKGKLDPEFVLKYLAGKGVVRLLVEGGGETHASFVEGGFADEVFCFIAPLIIGGRNALTGVEGEGVESLSKALLLKNCTVAKIGEDFLVHGYF